MAELTVAELAGLCERQSEGPADRVINGANTIENATASDIAFAENRKAFEAAASSEAGCLLVPPSFEQRGPWSVIRVEKPRQAFVQALAALYPGPPRIPAVHSTAIIAKSAVIGADCS